MRTWLNVLPVRGGVAAESHEVVLVLAAAEEEGDLDGARPLGGALHGAPHPERHVDGRHARLYRVRQLNLTPEIEVVFMLLINFFIF